MSTIETLWTAVSRLESQVARNPDLPAGYRQYVTDAFAELRKWETLLGRLNGPWRVSGQTEDGQMWKVSNRDGYVEAHTHSRDTAEALVELTRIG